MFTAIANHYDVMRYFDYTQAEAIRAAREWAGNGAELCVFRNGGGWAFPFGQYGRKVYDARVRIGKAVAK